MGADGARAAVLGVGLIGGSVGLALADRCGVHVSGFDTLLANLDDALDKGAIHEAHVTVADAVRDADVVYCAAPVGSLPELVRAALDATGEGTIVTDVGSTKAALRASVSGHPDIHRYIGGHPLAGAETSGVANARADLFEGARWYLTPDERSEGVLYDRLQKQVVAMGARPQAIDAEAHDRLMSSVSHLPHVLANILVEQAEGSSEVGPSLRDGIRVAGANPRMWADIMIANRDALADSVEATAERLSEVAGWLRAGDHDRLLEWQAEAAAGRARLLDSGTGEGEPRELKVVVANRPGTVAELALALGDAGVNIEDMSLSPAPGNASGAVSIWVLGDEQARTAADTVRRLGHAVTLADE